jgi:hypothetical protein
VSEELKFSMQIKIRTRYKEIPKYHRVYLLHAGRKKLFFEDFLDKSLVFMDLPGAKLAEGFKLEPEIKKELQRAKATADWMFRDKQHAAPSDNLDDYDPLLGEQGIDRKEEERVPLDGRSFGAIQALYLDAEPGDLVIVPSAGGAAARVLIGEFVGGYNENLRGKCSQLPEGAPSYPARKVRWLKTDTVKHDFSVKAYKSFAQLRTLHSLPASVRREIYDHAYGEYIFTDSSNMNINIQPPEGLEVAPEQWQVDALAAHDIHSLVLYYGGLYAALREERAAEYLALAGMYEAIHHELAAIDPFTWQSSVSSPGSITFRAPKDQVKALVVATILALAACPALAEAEQLADAKITLENSWSTVPSDCDKAVGGVLTEFMAQVSGDIWLKNCKIQQDAQSKIGATPLSDIEIEIADDSVHQEDAAS